ncbi:hypothetical protein vseg_018849 [Gypsophila vaccaria]
MKDGKTECIPVGKRTRSQRAIREEALWEENKRARAAAPSEHRKNKHDDEEEEEDVIVVDESEYLKRTSTLGGGGSSVNGGVGPEERSDHSVKILGEKWNPSGDDDDGGGDYEGSGGASDGSSSSFEDDGDDESSDEDFKVDVAEMRSAFSSEYSSSDDCGADFKQKQKRKTGETLRAVDGNDECPRKKNDGFLNEDKHSRVGDILCIQRRSSQEVWRRMNRNDKVHSERKKNSLTDMSGDSERDSFVNLSALHSFCDKADKPVSRSENCLRKRNERFLDESYVNWLLSSNSRQVESDHKIDLNLRNLCRGKKEQLSKYTKARIELESRRGYKSEDLKNYKDDSFVNLSLPVYPKNDSLKKFRSSEDGGSKIRSKLSKGKKVASETKPKNSDKYEACSFVGSSSVPHSHRHQNTGHQKRGKAPKNWYHINHMVEPESESKNFGGSENGDERKRARPRKISKVTMKSTIQWIHKHMK